MAKMVNFVSCLLPQFEKGNRTVTFPPITRRSEFATWGVKSPTFAGYIGLPQLLCGLPAPVSVSRKRRQKLQVGD